MAAIVKSLSSFVGALVALAVAVLGFLSHVGPVTLALRALIAGVVVALLARLLGTLLLFAVTSRYLKSEDEDDVPTESGQTPSQPE